MPSMTPLNPEVWKLWEKQQLAPRVLVPGAGASGPSSTGFPLYIVKADRPIAVAQNWLSASPYGPLTDLQLNKTRSMQRRWGCLVRGPEADCAIGVRRTCWYDPMRYRAKGKRKTPRMCDTDGRSFGIRLMTTVSQEALLLARAIR